MFDLTSSQFLAIQLLTKSDLISEVGVHIGDSDGIKIKIKSTIGAKWDGLCGVDSLLVEMLDESFPDLEYMGIPANHTNPLTGIDEDIYFINYQGETLIWLIMQIGNV